MSDENIWQMSDKTCQTTTDDRCHNADVKRAHCELYLMVVDCGNCFPDNCHPEDCHPEDCHHGPVRQDLRCELYVLVQEWTLASHKKNTCAFIIQIKEQINQYRWNNQTIQFNPTNSHKIKFEEFPNSNSNGPSKCLKNAISCLPTDIQCQDFYTLFFAHGAVF